MIPLPLIGFAKAAWTLAKGVPWYVWLTVAVALAFVVNGAYEHRAGVAEGKKAVVEDLVRQDRKIENKADAAADRVTRCYGTGGSWNIERGYCDYGKEKVQ